jgi:hypothetical protein
MGLVAAATLLQQPEVDLASVVVDDDLPVHHRGAVRRRRGKDAGEVGELVGEVDAGAAGEHGRAVRGDLHAGPVAGGVPTGSHRALAMGPTWHRRSEEVRPWLLHLSGSQQ